MWRLLVPLNYLRIRHPEKIKFDLIFPIIFACLFSLPLLLPSFRSDAATEFDLLGRSSDILSILTGFFVAALAAVATFGGDEMNQPMSGADPMLLHHKNSAPETLTRRRFLCFLFGYLAFLSLFVYFLGFSYSVFNSYFIANYCGQYQIKIFVIFWMIYGVLIGNLLSNTLLGLFYLTDRMHRPNPKVTWSKDENGQPEK